MLLNEAIEHAQEASRREDLCLECRMEHEQLAKWLIELRIRRQADKKVSPLRINHPECVHQCKNRKTRIICLHCIRNPFAPSGDNKEDFFNQDVNVSIFEKRRNK